MKNNFEEIIYKSMITVTVCLVFVSGYIIFKGTQIEAMSRKELLVLSAGRHVAERNKDIGTRDPLDFTGKDVNDFENWAQENDIIYSIAFEYSDEVKENRIISQESNEKDEIAIVVSRGIDYSVEVTLPNFSGMTMEQIQAFAKKNHLSNITFNYVNDDVVAVGKFISMNINKTKVKRDEKIIITISLGKKVDEKTNSNNTVTPQKITIPTFTSETQAISWASSNGFTVGTITRQYSNTIATGEVYNQSPAAGTSHQKGSVTITFTVSLGRPEVPSFSGKEVSEARASLTLINNAGGNISITESTEYSDSIPVDKIIRQSASGFVNIGTTVNVVVSLGSRPIVYVNVGYYVGMDYEAARNEINATDGLSVHVDSSCSTDTPIVQEQSPNSGQVESGATVVIKCAID